MTGCASDAELERRTRLRGEQNEWNKPKPKRVDTLRITSTNAANNLSHRNDWLLLRAAMAGKANVVAMQEIGARGDDVDWKKEMVRAAKTTAGTDCAHASHYSSHQADGGRWVGGVAQIAVGETAHRCRSEPDVRGWGRYGIIFINGQGGKQVAVVNLYIRNDAATPTENHKLSTVLRKRAAAAPSGSTREAWKPKETPPKPTKEQVKDPALLLWDDIEMHVGKWAQKEKHTLIILGDFNIDPVRGDAGRRRVADLCKLLGLVHAAEVRHGEVMARQITTRRGLTDDEGKVIMRPSHLDHVLISQSANVLEYFTDSTATGGASDHDMLTIDLDTCQALGITEDGNKAPSESKRPVARAKCTNDRYRSAFEPFAANHYTKHLRRHGIVEAAAAIDRTDAELSAIAEQAMHTGTWEVDKWTKPAKQQCYKQQSLDISFPVDLQFVE